MKGIDEIVKDVLELAEERQKYKETACSDTVAAIHSLWMEIGLKLGEEMNRLREEERRGIGGS